MPAWRKSGGVWRQTTPYRHNGVSFTAAPVVKGFVRRSGVWQEFWPTIPDAPTVTVNSIYRNDVIEIDTTWTDPGGTAQGQFQVRLIFTDRQTGATSSTAWVTLSATTYAYTFTNSGGGWGSRSLDWNVRAQVVPFSGSATLGFFAGPTGNSDTKQVIQYPIPPTPTSFTVAVNSCNYAGSWAYTNTNRATNFQIQTWLDNSTSTTYEVPMSNRSWLDEPWTPTTVGARHTVNSRIRAVGPGGVSPWVTVTGIMPGNVGVSDVRFEGGQLKAFFSNNVDGVRVWSERYEGDIKWDHGRDTGDGTFASPVSAAWARDGVLRYRFRLQPETASGWTGQQQVTGWCIKMPNPVFFKPSNVLSIRSGVFYTSTDGRHVFQGLDSTGRANSALAWYGGEMSADFGPARIGYATAATQLHVAMRRYAVGGAGGGTRLSFWVHNQKSYSGGLPMYSDQEFGKYLVWDETVWAPVPLKYWTYWTGGTWHGLACNSALTSEYMLLWRHLTTSAGSLDGQPFWTIRVTHDG